jgi:hypothetical protein
VDYIQRAYARSCNDNLTANAPAAQQPMAQQFCALLNPDTPLEAPCRAAGLPDAVCDAFGNASGAGDIDTDLAPAAAEALLRGCDFLDPAHCLLPFPNDYFTVAAAPGSPQSVSKGGTGRRVNFNPLAMPRNTAGKPVDPTEWNRNDGFSPGQMILAYVPGLAVEDNGSVTGAVPIMDVSKARAADAPIFVIDAATGERQLVWAEIDLNANLLLIPAAPEAGTFGDNIERPAHDGRAALIIRPAKNFLEGHRYIVALRNLKNEAGENLVPNAGFRVCRGDVESTLREATPVKERCDHVEELMDTLALFEGAGFDRNELYLTWDFTVASAKNDIGRLAHMRDDAFKSLSTNPAANDCTQYSEGAPCTAPKFTVDKITPNPQSGIARRIEGTLTVPSYVVPSEPTPLDNPETAAVMRQFCATLPADAPQEFHDGCDDLLSGIALGATLPPNRLFYNPADAPNPNDPAGSRYGDGLPDRVGGVAEMKTRFICQIPEKALTEGPSRAGIYGHGLLDSRVAVTYDGVPDLSREHNFMFCAVDLFGFSTGDLVNVASSLVDLSNFPVVPDGSQQGLLNYIFLARLLRDANGFAADPAFQNNGAPLFDRREVFYDGNSQGGIVGAAVLAISKDVNRGVLGSLGMNYSTLLQRSKDFDEFSTPLYLSYTDPLDRAFLFSMMQMLWDRSENNGYAEHLTTKSSVEGGQVDAVLLNPMYGDQQVTMWSAAVMSRTMGIPVDYDMVTRAGKTHPDLMPGYPLPPVNYAVADGGANFSATTSALVQWADVRTAEPVPTGNIAHRAGRDPHDDSAKKAAGRCAKAHFLHRSGRLLDINTDAFRPEQESSTFTCPPQLDNSGAPGAGPGGTSVVSVATVIERWLESLSRAAGLIADGEFQAALDALLGGTQQLVADLGATVAQQAGALAGLSLPPPGPDAAPVLPAPALLRAGVAKGAIQVPVGTPLGGYLRPPVAGEYLPGAEAFAGGDPSVFLSELADFFPSQADGCDQDHPESCPPLAPIPDELRKIHSPYATYSPPSRGYYDSLIAKAVALYDGNDYVVLVKTDFIGMLDEVVQEVKAEVNRRQGIDLGDGLIMSATHTHDGPGALANHSTRYFWLAMDVYQHDVYRRIVTQLADVVVAALGDMKPARIGHATGSEVEGLNGYRRDRLASYADDDEADGDGISDADELRRRIGVIRVDNRDTGEPMAVIINWAAHGIAFDVENQYFSGDMLGSVERETEQLMRVPVAMLVQNTGGDVSPRGVSNDNKLQRIESYGKRMAPQVARISENISAYQVAPDLRSVSQRIILNRERLGYASQEYPYPWGAGQCGNDIAAPFVGGGVNDIPGYAGSGLPTKIPYCLPSPPPDALDLADNGVAENGSFYPQDTILSAAKIGDITLMVQPGEPLTEYGVRLMGMAASEGYDPDDTFVWGYSGDHVGYILPPVEEDWATFGGAESTTTFWGWKQGQRFIDVSRDLVKALRDRKTAPADEFQVNYGLYKQIYDQTPSAPVTPSLLPGTAVTQPSSIRRFETTRYVFEGGDPVLDFPSVLMERQDASLGWLPVRRANGEALDSFFEMHLKYRLVSGRHLWTVEFEAPRDWAAGTYRFRVSGTARMDSVQSYALESTAFVVTHASTLQAAPAQCAGGVCSTVLQYTPQPDNYRVIDSRVPADEPAPVRRGAVTFSNGVVSVTDHDTDGDGRYQASISGTVTASGADIYGNTTPGAGPLPIASLYTGSGVLGLLANLSARLNVVIEALSRGDFTGAGDGARVLFSSLLDDLSHVLTGDSGSATLTAQHAVDNFGDPNDLVGEGGRDLGLVLGLQADPVTAVSRTTSAKREVEPVVITGAQLASWSVPAAAGLPYPYPSGATISGQVFDGDSSGLAPPGQVRDAHNGQLLYPVAGAPVQAGTPVAEIAAYAWRNGGWREIPVQVDERAPYFLANASSDFSVYSGTDQELTYVWGNNDPHTQGFEAWGMTQGQCARAYDTNNNPDGREQGLAGPVQDPVPGLDNDDEVVFMAADAGDQAPLSAKPAGALTGHEIALADPLRPELPRFVYLFRKPGGSSFNVGNGYVRYQRDANADQWIDRTFFADNDPQKLGTSNTGYGPNLSGTVCTDGTPATAKASSDRFPRDGMTVSTDAYQFKATGRWMLREQHVAKPGLPGRIHGYGPDLVDRWKGRAFQQSPDSQVSVVGFEDEQVNWEANSALLGERAGPVRALREVWGADSGTNVTKTETYYRDAVVFRYRIRVHPIPPDGLYTSWDYNLGAMVPSAAEAAAGVPAGRYFTSLHPQGVPVDGINDEFGNVDSLLGAPAFFDAPDPTHNIPLAVDNWEQVSGKGDLGSLVYTFVIKGATSFTNALLVPYYRDDACLDDGTGDDPVQRPYPGESSTDSRVQAGYAAASGVPYAQVGCYGKQGAIGQHGVHFFFTQDSDNLFSPVTSTEVDGEQWQFAVPTDAPRNIGEPYANVVRIPLVTAATPRI